MKRHLLALGIAFGSLLLLTGISGAQMVIEDFEDGDLSEYTATGTGNVDASVTAAAAHDGSYGLEMHGVPLKGDVRDPDYDEDWIYRNDPDVYNEQGDVISFWVKVNRLDQGRAYCGFGATAAGCYCISLAPNTMDFRIYANPGYGYETLSAVAFTWEADKWYRLEADWAVGGLITGRVYDSDGCTMLLETSVTDTRYTSGGIAFRYWYTDSSGMGCFDTIINGAHGPSAVENSTWGGIKSLLH